MSRGSYTRAIDMWSVGCVFGELLQRVSYLGKAATPQLQVGGWGVGGAKRRLQGPLPSLAAAALGALAARSLHSAPCCCQAHWVCAGVRPRRLVPLQALPHRAGLIGSRLVPLQALPHSAPPTCRWPPCLPSKACPAPQPRARHSRAPATAPSARWVRPDRAAAPPPSSSPTPSRPVHPGLPVTCCVCALPGMDLRPLPASRAWGVGFFDGLCMWPCLAPCHLPLHSPRCAVLRRARRRK